MKRQIRRGVFETNSSSVHSLTMCSDSEFNRWKNGELLFWQEEGKFATRNEIIEELKTMQWYDGSMRYANTDWSNDEEVDEIFSDERIKTCEEFFEDDWYETYRQEYKTKGGEKIIAFGYYGHD